MCLSLRGAKRRSNLRGMLDRGGIRAWNEYLDCRAFSSQKLGEWLAMTGDSITAENIMAAL